MSDPQPAAFQSLSLLLQLEASAREAPDSESLGYTIANETRRLLDYQRAVVARPAGRGVRVTTVSAVSVLDRQSPFLHWIEQVIGHLASAREAVFPRPQELPEHLRADWSEFAAPAVVLLPLAPPHGPPAAWLWLAREQPWGEPERVLLERLGATYGHAWQALLPRTRRRPAPRRLWWLLVPLLLALVLALPVRQSALAPAEVVPRDPLVVASPLAGVVREMLVAPNQPVAVGEPLVRFEDLELRTRAEVVARTLSVAEAELRTARQGAFSDARSKARLALLEKERDLRAAELAHAEALLERVVVTAERPGIAVYRDPNDWVGRPVQVGERLLLIADPGEVELEAQLAAADAIDLEPGAPVELFLDAAPLAPLEASLSYVSYAAEPTPAGALAYRLKARFAPGETPRVGLRGMAKVSGERVPLALYLFRRPLSALRQTVGW